MLALYKYPVPGLFSIFLSRDVLCIEDSSRALLYLSKYGYVAPRNGSAALLTEEALNKYVTKAVRDFQVDRGGFSLVVTESYLISLPMKYRQWSCSYLIENFKNIV